MTELAMGWTWARFSDVARVASDLVDPSSWPDVPHVAPNHVESGTGRLSGVSTVAADGVTSPKHRFRAGQVLYSKIRPYLAKAALAPYPGLCSADMYPIEASIESRYLLHWMLSDDFTAFAAAHQGRSVLPKINQAALGTLPIPVAPLPEQQRIVEAIDEALSKLDAGEAGLRTVRLLLKRMRDAVLAAAVTGRLVAQHTTHNPATKLLTDLGVEASTSSALRELPAGWTPSVLGDVAEWSSGGTPKAGTARYYGGCIPWAVIGDLTEGPVWNTASSLTKDGLAESSAKVVPEGTVLLAMYGASIGRIGVAARAMATNQAIACARPRTELIAGSYLFWFLRSQRQAFVEQGKGAAQPNISQTILKGWPIALPPVDEQHRIIAEVERQFSFLEACERAVDVGLASATAVRRSVLKAAFEGKLVPQDPSDEPASILLERIRGERAAASKRARQARTKA